MSLLMQALKKAERAKQNSLDDSGVDQPSAEFDALLSLPPPAPPAAPGAAASAASAASATPAKRELSLDLEPMAELSLAPLAGGDAVPAPAAAPTTSTSGRIEPGLALELAPEDPTIVPAAPAPGSPVMAASVADTVHGSPEASPAQSPEQPRAAALASGAAAYVNPAKPATAAAPQAARAAEAAQQGARSGATATAGATAGPAAGGGKSAPHKGGNADKPRGAARARAAAASSDEASGIDPARLRLLGLIGGLLLILAIFGYVYWRALVAPGDGARLPMVPMPPPGAAPAQLVAVPAGGATDTAAADYTDPALISGGKRDDLERRLARTEQDLAQAVQAIQAQAAQRAPAPETLPPVAAPDNTEIRVARNVQASAIAPALQSGYQALNSGDLPRAQQQYEAALKQDANNRDALLGMAALAVRQNQGQQAASYYLRLLELDPNDSTAVAGLIGLHQGDAGQSENRLKAILNQSPEAAPVLFALGNLYARQGRWPEAQQTYFRAYSAAPDNADYAYNLAIGLDRLNQGKLAATYYQRALTLSQNSAANFNRDALRKRLQELGAQ